MGEALCLLQDTASKVWETIHNDRHHCSSQFNVSLI